MKKWTYMLSGIVIGAVLMASSNVFADQIKSLVGKTVAGEYTVNVNGKVLSDKAIVVDSKSHIPLRAISDSLGATIKVEGKTIEVTTNVEEAGAVTIADTITKSSNPYLGQSKESLQESRNIFMNKIIIPSQKYKLQLEEKMVINQKNLELAEKDSGTKFKEAVLDSITTTKNELNTMNQDIQNAEAQVKLIDEALTLLQN
ncbi:hypothetical protein M2444_005349 [Paenibacillus sp. PastF-3]|uniref:2,' 3'-cyclic nucleotide 2'-phosphodiesterase n=1 Tax=Paenibacillus sp. PastF-3 TaxID=2940626 RepID=UPI002475E5A8|nr:2,' 3'-cyclic nucleotide 2'-phosphodiesterase [Paenibacillus sp. PastF-3]MDH6373517.1 hypothetical protein [Paenibacillus sp. PastF-3]